MGDHPRAGAPDPRVKGLQFSRNFGQHYGITAGLDHCDGDWVVVMDCDLQDRPEEIPRLYAKAREGYEVVIARRGKRNDPLRKRLASWVFYRLFSWLADIDYDGQAGNFRIVSRKVVAEPAADARATALLRRAGQLDGLPDRERSTCSTTSATPAPRPILSPSCGSSLSRPSSRIPTSRCGCRCASASCSPSSPSATASTSSLHALLYGSAISGWASLIVSIYFIGGIIIAILGVIGIYLGKAFDEAKKRPLYIVMHTTFDGGRKAD